MSDLRLNGYITRPQLWALDEACKPIRDTFPSFGPYLVGSVMERPTFRDVDVRLILEDHEYDRLSDPEWGLIGFVFSRHLAAVTGLPIDFQVQRQTEANAAYPDKPRNPRGVRGFEHHWIGDQRPPAPADADACVEQTCSCSCHGLLGGSHLVPCCDRSGQPDAPPYPPVPTDAGGRDE